MAKRNKLFFGLGIFGICLGVVALIMLLGAYSGMRRVEQEKDQRDALAKIETEIGEEAITAVEHLPIMYKERVQPLDSVARSVLREMSGKRKLYGVPPAMLFLSMAFDDSFDWEGIPLFLVEHLANKERLGMEGIEKYTTLPEIENSSELMEARQEAIERNEQNAILAIDREVFTLFGHARRARERFASLFLMVPPTEDQLNSETPDYRNWHLVGQAASVGHDPLLASRLNGAFDELKASWKQRDGDAIVAAADKIESTMAAMGPGQMPRPGAIQEELDFNRTNPFGVSSWLFFASAALAFFALGFRLGFLWWSSFVTALAGFVLMLYGIYVRVSLNPESVAITNLYESMVATAGLAVALGLAIDLGRVFIKKKGAALPAPWSMAFAGLGGFAILQVVDHFTVKFNDGVGGTIAVLANNVWVHIHVPVVMLAYAAYFVAFMMSVVGLPWVLFNDRRGKTPELKSLLKSSEIAVNIGAVFMFAGLILGGIWAHVSWGRFWGWDPKETWALILFLFYMVVIHGRFTGKLNAFWSTWMLFLGGNVLLWTYYGTNELLSGLHSYANSAGDKSFWDNFIHERNRWFVYATLGMGGISLGSVLFYLLSGGAARATAGKSDSDEEIDEDLRGELSTS